MSQICPYRFLQMRAGGRQLTVNWRERPSALTRSLHENHKESQHKRGALLIGLLSNILNNLSYRHTIACICLFPWIKHGILHLCVCFMYLWTKLMKKKNFDLPQPWQSLIGHSSFKVRPQTDKPRFIRMTHLNLDKTLMIVFHLCIQSSFYRLGSQVKTICYNLVPGKCKSTFQIRWNKNHAVHYILYS